MKFDPEQIKRQNPIVDLLRKRYNLSPKKTLTNGQVYYLCPFHNEETPSFRVNPASNGDLDYFVCGGCDAKGDVISFVRKKEGVSFNEACEILGGKATEPWKQLPQKDVVLPNETIDPEEDWPKEPKAIYDYKDEFGRLAYQSLRFERPSTKNGKTYEKTFRQRRPDGNGGWIWKTEGVRLVLYRLPDIMKSNPQVVHICEGEKDCDTLWNLGFPSTTNVSGAGKWKDAYSESLRDRELVIWPDQDDPGRKHAQTVLESVSRLAKNVRLINVPEPFKDITEWFDGYLGTEPEFVAELKEAIVRTTPLYRGIDLPVKGMAEMEQTYIRTCKQYQNVMLDLSKWLPGFRGEPGKFNGVRGLVPGEVVVFMGETGIGKTALLQNLAINAAPLTTLLFEIELPEELSFERFVAAAYRQEARALFDLYASGNTFNWRDENKLGHVFVCSKSDITCADIERIIVNSELKIDARPALVEIDYIGLVKSLAKSRYERVSDIAERMKVIAKNTGTIIVLASQIHRRLDAKSPDITLYDAKDSGSIENSSGLVLGAWRDQRDPTLMKIRVLKNTKGRVGLTIDCNFTGSTMRITERIIDPADVPKSPLAESQQTLPVQ